MLVAAFFPAFEFYNLLLTLDSASTEEFVSVRTPVQFCFVVVLEGGQRIAFQVLLPVVVNVFWVASRRVDLPLYLG